MVVEATTIAVCRFTLTVASRGSSLATELVISLDGAGCWALLLTRPVSDHLGWMPLSAATSSRALATTCWPAVDVPSQTANVVAAFWFLDLALTARPKSESPYSAPVCPVPATSGNAIGMIVKFLGLFTPAAEIAELIPAAVAYCMYQVPIIIMAYLP